LFIRGVALIDHYYGSCFKRCPELFGRKRTVRRKIKAADLEYVGEGRYKGYILEGGKRYAFILRINPKNIAIIITIYNVSVR
jgi:hypothetical protein